MLPDDNSYWYCVLNAAIPLTLIAEGQSLAHGDVLPLMHLHCSGSLGSSFELLVRLSVDINLFKYIQMTVKFPCCLGVGT